MFFPILLLVGFLPVVEAWYHFWGNYCASVLVVVCWMITHNNFVYDKPKLLASLALQYWRCHPHLDAHSNNLSSLEWTIMNLDMMRYCW